jgi:hypothetical protein
MQRLVKLRWFWIGVVGLAVVMVTCIFVAILAARTSRLEVLRQVKVGMTKTEVEKIVGQKIGKSIRLYGGPYRFRGDGPLISVWFGESGKVEDVTISEKVPDNRTYWTKIKDECQYQMSKVGW